MSSQPVTTMEGAFTCSTGVFQESKTPLQPSAEEPNSFRTPESVPLQVDDCRSTRNQSQFTPANSFSHDYTYESDAIPSADNILSSSFGNTYDVAANSPKRETASFGTFQDNLGCYDAHSTERMQMPCPTGSIPQSMLPSSEAGDECIYVYVIVAVDEQISDELWKYLNTSLFITQPVTEEEMSVSGGQNTFACFQQVVEIPSQSSKHFREISARIFIKNYIHHTQKRFLFQLFLQVSERNSAMPSAAGLPWDKLDVVSFIQLPSTGQILRPIGREVMHEEALGSAEGMFLGSFMMFDTQLYHHLPTEETLKQQELGQYNDYIPRTIDSTPADVVIVEKEDIVLETNGARAGRPSHRLTGQLLMTRSQVEKILEIRGRWNGLSPRQRRDNVSATDFYTFFTLNRDETAECLGVCATWLKDAIRAHGVNVWPGRPLRRSGAALQTLKENMESAQAALRFSHPSVGETDRLEEEVKSFERKIEEVLELRLSIVKSNVSAEYFAGFLAANGQQYLDPEWNALPPFSMPREHRA
ncbi:hypothetical protein BWQ96_00246 [Gracilariopsis chorda]|uniref:RWP-RK domain-containing protein n=1 Tax=Gracilariopsis chorda TaxID=448386 RepID=A0A2V3J6M9_9FLOR|nr:hypothetical protein BWQ96_00246 [Gracilariopsis chorda]|eukprot:PXF50086.1 hypothetical protein BWQ96_00246 [Gracilariopsis chorda]